MATEEETPAKKQRRRSAPPTAADYENRLVGMAFKQAEDQLAKGEASSQVVSYLLKVGGTREQLELERLRKENLLTEAKIKNMEQLESIVGLLQEAKSAMMSYRVEPPRVLDE